jgi:hypothetical protein
MITNTDAVPSQLPDDLNPEVVKATAVFIGKCCRTAMCTAPTGPTHATCRLPQAASDSPTMCSCASQQERKHHPGAAQRRDQLSFARRHGIRHQCLTECITHVGLRSFSKAMTKLVEPAS